MRTEDGPKMDRRCETEIAEAREGREKRSKMKVKVMQEPEVVKIDGTCNWSIEY